MTLAPITALTGKDVKFVWSKECDNAFKRMKAIMAEQTMVTLPQYNRPFDVQTDASKKQIGAYISQEGKPLAFFSRKMNPAQLKYPVGEKQTIIYH